MKSKNLDWLVVYVLFCQNCKAMLPEKQADQLITETMSAIIRLVLPHMGFALPAGERKISKKTKQEALEYMKKLSVRQFPKAARLFDEALPNAHLSHHSRNTYGGRARNWFNWTKISGYWPGVRMSDELEAQCAPVVTYNYGSSRLIKLTDRQGTYKAYALKTDEMNLALQQWFKEAEVFFTRHSQPGRVFPAIQPYTFKLYRRGWLLVLGWQHRFNGVPLEKLGPQHIFPVVDLDEYEDLDDKQKKRLWRQKQRELELIICDYRSFMIQEMKSFIPATWDSKLNHIQAAGRFLYADWVEFADDYKQIPLFKRLKVAHAEIRKSVVERQKSLDVACLSKKWIEVSEGQTALGEFQRRVLEPMRQDCQPRVYKGRRRSPRRLAHLYQQYVRVSMMGHMPPLRQQVDRSLQLALSCSIDRPEFVPLDGVYYPLPPNEVRKRDEVGQLVDNYLYYTYRLNGRSYPQGIWVREVQQQKTRQSMGVHQTIIPNRRFNDGKCLYNYITGYLEGVWCPQSWSGRPYQGSDSRYFNTQGIWATAGRSTFNPQDSVTTDIHGALWRLGTLFISPYLGRPYSEHTYHSTIKLKSHRLVGKSITPHTMRYFWATWGFQVGLSDIELRSLAYMMGHSVDTLRRLYAKLAPVEQQQAIEDAITIRLCHSDSEAEVLPLSKLLRAVHHLARGDQKQLFQHLQQLLDEGGESQQKTS